MLNDEHYFHYFTVSVFVMLIILHFESVQGGTDVLIFFLPIHCPLVGAVKLENIIMAQLILVH